MNIKNIKRDRYSKVLYHAVHRENARMVRFLLKGGACTKIRDNFGNSLLHITAKKGSGNIIHSLLKHGCDINSQNCIGDTALNYAILFNQKHIVEILLKMGANIRIKNCKGENSLYYAVKTNNLELTRLLLKHVATTDDVNDVGCSALQVAILREQEKIVKLLVSHYKQFNDICCKKSLLHLTVRVDNHNIINILLDAGADINFQDSNGFSVLHYAIQMKKVELIKMLIEKGADLNSRNKTGLTSLHHAVLTGDEQIVALLLNCGADVQAKILNGDTALHIAVIENEEKCNINILIYLFQKKANANEPNDIGKTPFHIVLENGNDQLTKLFLEHGADVTAKDHLGRTALFFAAKSGNRKSIELILDNSKISINESTNVDGATALHIAAKFAKIDCIELLIERGADVNCTDLNGDTPIFYVAQWPIRNGIHQNLVQEYEKSGKILLKHGADVNYETILRENVFELSVEERNTIMINLIIEHLAIMEARKLPISESNKKLLRNDELFKLHYEFCQKELIEMKKRKVYGTVSLFNILEADVDVIVGYARNANLVHAFKSNNYSKTLPIYCDLLLERFSEGIEKQKALKTAFIVLSNILQLPDRFRVIYEMILRYINDKDLQKLIENQIIS